MLREFAWNRHRLNALLLGCAITLPVRAQSDSPFDAPPEPAPALSPAELQELNSQSPLATVPKTPRQLFEAAVAMVDIGRTDLARKYLQQVTPGSLTDEQLTEIREAVGSPNLLRLEAIPELEALVQPLVERSNDVLRRRAAEPRRVQGLLADLGKTPEARATALAELKNLGPFAVPTLLASAVTEKDPARIADITTLCMSAGAPAIGPLEASLQAPEPVVQKIAAEALGRIGQSQQAIPDLEYLASGPDTDSAVRQASQLALRRLAPRPGPGGATAPGSHLDPLVLSRRLMAAAKTRLQEPLSDGTDPAAKISEWTWDRQKKSLVQQQVPARIAADRAALRHATRAVQLAPDDTHPQVVQRACELAAQGGPEYLFPPAGQSPAPATDPQAPYTSTSVWSQVLDLGTALRRPEIAARAAQALAKQPETYNELNWSDPKNPLLQALGNPDPRVQFAAAESLVTRGPKHPYRGAPQVVEVLRRMLDSDASRPFAIVGEVAADRAADISGMLRELGFDTLTAVSGREAFRAASERSDVALIVLHPNVIRWTLSETVANLRYDTRTAHLPIVVYGPARLAPKFLKPVPGQHQLHYATYVETADELRTQVGPVIDAALGQTPPAGQREELRGRSIDLLRKIAEMKGTRVYDLTGLEEALAKAGTDPNLAESAFRALASLGTRRAQGLLAESLINAPGEPVAPLVTQLLNDHIRKYGQFLPRSILRDVNVSLASARGTDGSAPGPNQPPGPNSDGGGLSRQPGDTFENPLEGDTTTEESSLDDIPADQAGEQ
ncbi:MAG: HEAT repeat domain-containing protein [Planctomycetaceae bacterium]